MGIFSAVWLTTLQQHVPEEALSRVSAWDWMGSFLFLPLGLLAAGPVSDLIGISRDALDLVAWAVLSTLVVVLVPSVRNLRRLDVPDKPEEGLARLRGETAEAFHAAELSLDDVVAARAAIAGRLHRTPMFSLGHALASGSARRST